MRFGENSERLSQQEQPRIKSGTSSQPILAQNHSATGGPTLLEAYRVKL